MKDNKIEFTVSYSENGERTITMKEPLSPDLGEKEKSSYAIIGTILTNGALQAADTLTTQAFKAAGYANDIIGKTHLLKIKAFTIAPDYMSSLHEERQKYGNNEIMNHAVALGQTLVGVGFSAVGGLAGSIAGTPEAPGIGTIALGFSGAVSASVFYEEINIYGRSSKAWVGDAVRFITPGKGKLREFDKSLLKQTGENQWSYNTKSEYVDSLFSSENLLNNFNIAREQGIPYASVWDYKTNSHLEEESTKFYSTGFNSANKAGFDQKCSSKYKDDRAQQDTFFEDMHKKFEEAKQQAAGQNNAQEQKFNEPPAAKTHTFTKGETVWKFAQDHGMSVDDLLKVPGNEYLNQNRYKDTFGRDHIKIKAGDKINIPYTQNYKPYTWSKYSSYGDPIKTTSGNFGFASYFNSGTYRSPFNLDKNTYSPFKNWNKNSQFYDHHYADVLQKLKDIEMQVWKLKNNFQGYKKPGKEYSSHEGASKKDNYYSDNKAYEKEFNWNSHSNSFGREYSTGYRTAPLKSFIIPGIDEYGRVHFDVPINEGKLGTVRFWGGGLGSEFHVGSPYYRSHFPLAIDLKNDGLKLTALEHSTAFYDINNASFLNNVGWPDKEDALLAVDIDGDNIINQAKEIVFKLWNDKAITDLEGLRLAFDKNKDGKVDKNDPDFSKLRVWQDRDQNGVSEPDELKTLNEAGIEAFLLDEIAEIKGDKEQGGNKILKAVKIQAPGKAIGNLYDVILQSSKAGVSYEEDFGEIVLRYPDKKEIKVSKVVNEAGETLNLSNTNYTVAIGNKGKDIISASNNNTVIDGYEDDDILTGGDGHDWLKGGEGSDTLKGGKGHDILLIDSDDKQENIDGGEGVDIALVATKKAVVLDLAKANIEAAYGNKGSDKFSAQGSSVGVYIDGGEGNDDIEGSDHNDVLIGGTGFDKIRAGKGDDDIYIDAIDHLDNIDGGEGEDSLYVYGKIGIAIFPETFEKLNVEKVFGSTGNDHFSALTTKKNITLFGNAGNDYLCSGEGDDTLDGGLGNDTMLGMLGNDKYRFYLGAGHDTIINFNYGIDRDLVLLDSSIKPEDIQFKKVGNDLKLLLRSNNNDLLTIQDWYLSIKHQISAFILDSDLLEPKTIVFKDGTNNAFSMDAEGAGYVIFTMDGDDTIQGSQLADFINGGAGKDEIQGLEGDDTLTGGEGDGDYLQGGLGNDTYFFNRGDGKDIILDEYKYKAIKGTGVEKATRTYTVTTTQEHCFPGVYGFQHCFPYKSNTVVTETYDRPYTEYMNADENGGTADKILFGYGILPSDLLFKNMGSNLTVYIKEGSKKFNEVSDTLTIINCSNVNNQIELLAFTDTSEIINLTATPDFISSHMAD